MGRSRSIIFDVIREKKEDGNMEPPKSMARPPKLGAHGNGYSCVRMSSSAKKQNTASGLLILYGLVYLMIPNTVYFFDGLFDNSSFGFQMTVFITTLLADGIYLMIEVRILTIPASIQDIPQFLTNSDEIVSILKCFESWCSPSLQPQPSLKRKRVDDEVSANIVSRTRSIKRRSYTHH